MNILDTIIAHKKIEVDERKQQKNIAELQSLPAFKSETLSFKNFLISPGKTGIIAEFKRRSPSKGVINNTSSVTGVTLQYVQHGASAISVLTDEKFFGGSLQDLVEARSNNVPVLRKEFIIDEYQLIESKAFGADIILLIAACLSRGEVKSLSQFAKNIGLNVLLEIHDDEELGHICDDVDVVGINNRNLKTFKVDISHSIDLANKLPAGMLKISESGIDEADTILLLKQNGFNGFLIGERFMKENDPGLAFKDFVEKLTVTQGR